MAIAGLPLVKSFFLFGLCTLVVGWIICLKEGSPVEPTAPTPVPHLPGPIKLLTKIDELTFVERKQLLQMQLDQKKLEMEQRKFEMEHKKWELGVRTKENRGC